MESRYIVTISREFGSGGREIGKKLADKLGVPFYDKTVSEFTAVASGFKPEIVEAYQDKTPSGFEYGVYSRGNFVPIGDELFFAQSKVISTIADKGPCVIVGRCADFVLKNRDDVVDVFVTAPIELRVKRIQNIYNLTDKKALRIIRTNDRARRRYHEHYADMKWGVANNYDIVVNSKVGIDCAVDTIIELLSKYGK